MLEYDIQLMETRVIILLCPYTYPYVYVDATWMLELVSLIDTLDYSPFRKLDSSGIRSSLV